MDKLVDFVRENEVEVGIMSFPWKRHRRQRTNWLREAFEEYGILPL